MTVAPATGLASASVKVTVTPSTGPPRASPTRACNGAAYRPWTRTLRTAGATAPIDDAVARLSSPNVTTAESSLTDAVAVKRPGEPFARNAGEVAIPEALVCTVACGVPPRKLAPAP